MDFLKFVITDVGPYFGVFALLAAIIYWQMRLIIAMLRIEERLDVYDDNDEDCDL